MPEFNGVSLPRHILRFPLLYDLSKNQQSAKKLKNPTNIHFLVGLYRGPKQHNFFFLEFKDQHFPKLSKPLFCWSSYNIRNFVCGVGDFYLFLIRRETCVWRKRIWFAFKALFFRLGAFSSFTQRGFGRVNFYTKILMTVSFWLQKTIVDGKVKKVEITGTLNESSASLSNYLHPIYISF